MRSIILLTSALLLVTLSFGQEGKTKEKVTSDQREQATQLLPVKEGQEKQIYELSESGEYKVFTQYGDLMAEGTGKKIDYTRYPVGTYFVVSGETKAYFKKEE